MDASSFDVMLVNDLSVVLVDLDQRRSVMNDAPQIVKELHNLLPGGIGDRSVYYRDTTGRFDRLLVSEGVFSGVAPCTPNQQDKLTSMVFGSE